MKQVIILVLVMSALRSSAGTHNILDSITSNNYNYFGNVVETATSLFVTRSLSVGSANHVWLEKYDKASNRLMGKADIYNNFSKPDTPLSSSLLPITLHNGRVYTAITKYAWNPLVPSFLAATFTIHISTFDSNLNIVIPEYELLRRSDSSVTVPTPSFFSSINGKLMLVYFQHDTMQDRSIYGHAAQQGDRLVDKGTYPLRAVFPNIDHRITNVSDYGPNRILSSGTSLYSNGLITPSAMQGFVLTDTNFNVVDTM